MRRLLFLLPLALLLFLLAWPPLLKGAVLWGLGRAGFRAEVERVLGFLPFYLKVQGLRLEGEGVGLKAQEVWLSYSLLGLLRRELPVGVRVKEGVLRLTWEGVFPEAPPGPPPPVRLLFQSLVLEGVEVEFPQGQRLFLPPLRLALEGSNPYAFLARLPGGVFRGEARALGPELGAWEVAYRGEVRGLGFFYQGLKGGVLEGRWRLGPEGVLGENRVEGGVVELVGFTLEGVFGEIRFAQDQVQASLQGQGLEGPLWAQAQVDLKAPEYRFTLKGRPKLRALARHYGLELPLEGDGVLELEGAGWEEIRVQGGFQGEGRLLGQAFRHRGRLGFDRVFRLWAEAEGALWDRRYTARLDLEGDRYRVRLQDTRGSLLGLVGQGGAYRAEGRVAWPRPLEGLARVAFRGKGGDWTLRVESPGVSLPLFRPLDLSGWARGEGGRVEGVLGPLRLEGAWTDLVLELRPTPLLLGEVEGRGSLKAGRLWARLFYQAPYTRFPLEVRQEGPALFRFLTPYGEGVYRDGTLGLGFRGLPIEALDRFRLYGQAGYGPEGLFGALRLQGRYLHGEARLRGEEALLEGLLSTPLGEVPWEGVYRLGEGLEVRAQGLVLSYREALNLKGQLALGPLDLRADLAYGPKGFGGWAEAEGPWGLWVRLLGQGEGLALRAQGPLEAQGEVWPEPRVEGRLAPPLPGGLELPPLAFRLDRRGVELKGAGWVRFGEGWPFALDLPFGYRGMGFRLKAQGGLLEGEVHLYTPYGLLQAKGPWGGMALGGKAHLPYLGQGGVGGRLDLLGLRYAARLELEKGYALDLSGQGLEARFRALGPGLYALGAWGQRGLDLLAELKGLDLSPFGLPLEATGRWGTAGGSLRLAFRPAGEAVAEALLEGEGLLKARFRLLGPYLRGEGEVGLEGLEARLEAHYRAGPLALDLRAQGGGAWGDLRLGLEGDWGLWGQANPLEGEVLWEGGRLRYRLAGPLSLEGEGLRYRGRMDLAFPLLGREASLEGVFKGEGLRLEASGEGAWAGVPLAWRGGYGEEGPFLRLDLPEGWAALAGDRVGLDLEVRPWAEALGLPLEGRLQGQVDLRGQGEVAGRLRAYGEALDLAYGEGVLRAYLPGRGLGLAWAPRTGEVRGLGALEGAGVLDPRGVEARFRWEGVGLALRGPWGDLALEGQASRAGLGEVGLEARLDLLGQRGQGRAWLQGPWAEGHLDLLWEGRAYRGEGWLKGLRHLEQEGPLRLKGEGARAELLWEAPLALGLAYEGGLTLWARGEGEVAGASLALDLAYREGYVGWLKAELPSPIGPVEVLAQGQGEALRFRVAGEGLRGEGEMRGLEAKGEASYRYAWPQGEAWLRLGLEAGLWGFRLQGQGGVRGEGVGIPFRLAYAWAPGEALGDPARLEVEAQGPGLDLVLRAGRLDLWAGLDLEPFGLPLRLKAQAQGPWEGPIHLALEGPGGRLAGVFRPKGLLLELKGEVLGEGVALWGEGLAFRLNALGPNLEGEASWRYGERPQGVLAFRYPLGRVGRVAGTVDLAAGRYRLLGEGGLKGGVEGEFGLPPPFGEDLLLTARGEVAYGAVRLRLDHAYRERKVQGEGRLETPYGGVRLLGEGPGLRLLGEGLPLEGEVRLSPLALRYRYEGELPQGLGRLEAQGAYPGVWLKGQYRYGVLALGLKGEGEALDLEGEGVWGRLTLQGMELSLEDFRYGPLGARGWVRGSWKALKGEVLLSAWGREARLQGLYTPEGFQARLTGNLEGEVAWRGRWQGEVRFREGTLALSGEGLPQAEGEVLGLPLRFSWPGLEVAGLHLDLLAREAWGEADLPYGLRAQGEGHEVGLLYPTPWGPVEARLDLRDLGLSLGAGFGEGGLRYREGRVEGAWAWRGEGWGLELEGAGDRVLLRARHGAFPWWAPGPGEAEGEVGLTGAYRVEYRAENQVLRLTGRLLEARLQAQGAHLQGELLYPQGGRLSLDLPLPPLGARLQGQVLGEEGYPFQGVLALDLGRVELKGRLQPFRGKAWLEGVALEDLLDRYAPYLRGQVTGEAQWEGLGVRFRLQGEARVGEEALGLSAQGAYAPGGGEAQGQLGETPFRLALREGVLDLEASPRGFPLHLLLAVLAGPLEGEAYWTGGVRLRLPLADPLSGQGVLVGEGLVFRGGGDELRGRAAFRLGEGRVYIDHLRLLGRGSWEGDGYWSPKGSDLRLSLKDTVFTPVLRIIPALRPYRPEGEGSLELRLRQDGFRLEAQGFRFRLGPVAGEFPQALLELNGGAKAEGRLRLTAPFLGEARLRLEGDLEAFQVVAEGQVSLPGLPEATPARLVFRYPGYRLALELAEAQAEGTLFPLRLAGYGRLPVAYPRYYLQEGLLDVKSFFLYEEKGTYYLTGNAQVLRARIALPEGAQSLKEGVEVGGPKPEGQVPLVFQRVRLYADRGILVQESLAQGELRGEVYLEGPYADPYLVGEAVPLWGSFKLWNTLFTLDSSASYARFSQDRGLFPVFFLKARAEVARPLFPDREGDSQEEPPPGDTQGQPSPPQVQSLPVTLEVKGEFVRESGLVRVRLEPVFTSDDPSLSEPELLLLLALGTPDLRWLRETLPQTLLGVALRNLLLGQLERELARAFGLDQVLIELPDLQVGDLGTARFSVAKALTPGLFLGYEINLRGEQGLSLQYRLDGLTLGLASLFSASPGRPSRFSFNLGYDLTPGLALGLGLESGEDARFSLALYYRW